jgi:large subunit ribosomal protein L17
MAHLKSFTDYHQTPHELLPKLFGPLRERYANRPGGYTRVLRVEPKKDDQAPSAILELVDGPKDMRFMLTARTLARLQKEDKEINDLTAKNITKVTRFREGGEAALEEMVKRMSKLEFMKKERDAMEKKWAQKP